jgi:hypothetical protein
LPFTSAFVVDPNTVLGQLPAWCVIAASPLPAMSLPAIAAEPVSLPAIAAEPEPISAEPVSADPAPEATIVAEPEPMSPPDSAFFFLQPVPRANEQANKAIAMRIG